MSKKIAPKEKTQKWSKWRESNKNIKTLNHIYINLLLKKKVFYFFVVFMLIFAIISSLLPHLFGFKEVTTASLIVVSTNMSLVLLSIVFNVYYIFSYHKENGYDSIIKTWLKDDKKLIYSKMKLSFIHSTFFSTCILLIIFALSMSMYDDKINILLLYLASLLVIPILIFIFNSFFIVAVMYFKKMLFLMVGILGTIILTTLSILPVAIRSSSGIEYSNNKYSKSYIKGINIDRNKVAIFQVAGDGKNPMKITSNTKFTDIYPFSFLTSPIDFIFGLSMSKQIASKEMIYKTDKLSSLKLMVKKTKTKNRVDELVPLNVTSIFELKDEEKIEKLSKLITDQLSNLSDKDISNTLLKIKVDDSSVIGLSPGVLGANKWTFWIHELLENKSHIKSSVLQKIIKNLKQNNTSDRVNLFKYILNNYDSITSIKLEIRKKISEFIPIKGVFDELKDINKSDLISFENMISFSNNTFVIQKRAISINKLNKVLNTYTVVNGTQKNSINNVKDLKAFIEKHTSLSEMKYILRSFQKADSSINFNFSENSLERFDYENQLKIYYTPIFKSVFILWIMMIFATCISYILINKKIKFGYLNKRK